MAQSWLSREQVPQVWWAIAVMTASSVGCSRPMRHRLLPCSGTIVNASVFFTVPRGRRRRSVRLRSSRRSRQGEHDIHERVSSTRDNGSPCG